MLIAVAVYGVVGVLNLKGDLQDRNAKLQNSQNELKQLDQQLDKEKQDKNASQQQVQQLEQQKKDLESQLQAKIDQKATLAAAAQKAASQVFNTVTGTQTAYAASAPASVAVDGCGDNDYAHYIYMHESSCNLTVVNSEGCVGIGQACPASKLYNACPNLDYACENAFFTDYANNRYGGWAGAYAFWTANHWW